MYKIKIVLFVLMIIMTGCGDSVKDIELSTRLYECEGDIETDQSVSEICVYVHGQVKNPGVYAVELGSRLFHAIDMAGGFTKRAKQDYLNLAQPLEDGQSVYVMSRKEYQKQHTNNQERFVSQDAETGSPSRNTEHKININTATQQELMGLPGIGHSKAVAIVEFRENNGQFTAITDIQKVSGIGKATFSNIEDMITVG